MLLTLLLGVPAIGTLSLSLKGDTINNRTSIKKEALIYSLITFAISVIIWINYNENLAEYQSNSSFLGIDIGLDGLSLYFVLLTTLTLPLAILANFNNIIYNTKLFFTLYLLLEFFLILVFLSRSLISFYSAFEGILIPLYLMMFITDNKVEEKKLRAANFLFQYTLIGSLFMLLAFIYIILHVGSGSFVLLDCARFSYDTQIWLWLALFFSIAIKLPLIPVHLWLTKAHTEAPVGVSMILAGVVLKLAIYLSMRVLIPLLPEATALFTPMVQTIAIVTIIVGSLSTIRQTDIKCLVAYSSVVHMGTTALGLFSNELLGLEGAYILALAHGLVSPALFLMVGSILYDYYGTRVIRYYRGLTLYAPLLSIFFAFFTFANVATPLSMNFVGEFLALAGTTQNNLIVGILASSGVVLTAIYGIWLYNRMFFGSVSSYIKALVDINRRHFHILFILLILTYVLGIVPNVILEGIHLNISNILYYSVIPLFLWLSLPYCGDEWNWTYELCILFSILGLFIIMSINWILFYIMKGIAIFIKKIYLSSFMKTIAKVLLKVGLFIQQTLSPMCNKNNWKSLYYICCFMIIMLFKAFWDLLFFKSNNIKKNPWSFVCKTLIFWFNTNIKKKTPSETLFFCGLNGIVNWNNEAIKGIRHVPYLSALNYSSLMLAITSHKNPGLVLQKIADALTTLSPFLPCTLTPKRPRPSNLRSPIKTIPQVVIVAPINTSVHPLFSFIVMTALGFYVNLFRFQIVLDQKIFSMLFMLLSKSTFLQNYVLRNHSLLTFSFSTSANNKDPYKDFKTAYSILMGFPFPADNAFLEWFIGFAEGDGGIVTGARQLFFTITQKEKGVLDDICKIFQLGKVIQINDDTYRYVVTGNIHISLFYLLFNGHLVHPEKIKNLTSWYTQLLNSPRLKLELLGLSQLPLLITELYIPHLNHGWYSGFIDAEGSFFMIMVKKLGKIINVSFRFEINQMWAPQVIHHMAYSLFGSSLPVGVRVYTYYKNSDNEILTITSSSLKSVPAFDPLLSYLKQYPLRTKKAMSLKKWLEALELYKSHSVLTPKIIQDLDTMRKNINHS